jgi:uncharacterized protein YyaL (SSP411 family)
LCDAYRAFNNPGYLDLALKNAAFILKNLVDRSGRLIRTCKIDRISSISLVQPDSLGQDGRGEATIAFLDDYANIIDAFTALYEVTFNEGWLTHAKKLIDKAIKYYYDQAGGIFYYTAVYDEQLIARKSEIMDGVIPASNSVMARNLKKLALLFDDKYYVDISAQLLRNIVPHLAKYGSSYSNWITLLTEEIYGTYEIAIAGVEADGLRKEIENTYVPNKIILGGKKGSLPLLKDKFSAGTQIFICRDKTCSLPVVNVADALNQIQF